MRDEVPAKDATRMMDYVRRIRAFPHQSHHSRLMRLFIETDGPRHYAVALPSYASDRPLAAPIRAERTPIRAERMHDASRPPPRRPGARSQERACTQTTPVCTNLRSRVRIVLKCVQMACECKFSRAKSYIHSHLLEPYSNPTRTLLAP